MLQRAIIVLVAALAGLALAEGVDFEPGYQNLRNGVKVKLVKEGDGPSPTEADTVKVHYIGYLPDNSEFETTMKGTGPSTVQLKSAIKCWQQGIQTMRAGGKAHFFCPADTAFGKAGKMNGGTQVVPPNTKVEFEVELLEVIRGK